MGGSTSASTTSTTGTGGNGGTGGAPCMPAGSEDCTKPGDEDCDGTACSDAVWSKSFGSSGEQRVTSVAVDANGNVVIVGFFTGTMTFGAKTLISAGMNDYYLAKLDRLGNSVFAMQFGDASDNGTIVQVAVDKNGNIVLAGELTGSANFGSGPLTSLGNQDAFVAAFDTGGNPLWSKRFGDSDVQRRQHRRYRRAGQYRVRRRFQGDDRRRGRIIFHSWQQRRWIYCQIFARRHVPECKAIRRGVGATCILPNGDWHRHRPCQQYPCTRELHNKY